MQLSTHLDLVSPYIYIACLNLNPDATLHSMQEYSDSEEQYL